jgi:spore germination cell wall hydrolase CwlJ-like protein
MYHESRGEVLAGKAGVGYVITNRVKNKDFPDSVCGVIRQPHQFGFISRGLKVKNQKEFDSLIPIAEGVISGKIKNPVGNRLYFNSYIHLKHKTKPIKIGGHYFW